MHYYRVTITTDCLTIGTIVELDLDEYTGNLSAEAWRQSVIEAEYAIELELDTVITNRAKDIKVELLLDDDSVIQLKEPEREGANA